MVARAGTIDIDIGLDLRRFRRELNRARMELQRFERRMRRDFGSGARAMGDMDRQARRTTRSFYGMAAGVQAVTVAMGALAIYGTIRAFSEFEATLNSVQAVSGATASEFAILSDKAKELGATTKFTASDVAGAMQFMAMAGLQAGQIYGGVEKALTLAAAGNMDLAQSADIVTNIMTAMNLTTGELGRAVDVLTKTFTSSNTSLGNLGYAFKYVAPIASAAGIEFEEVSAALGLLGNAGMQGTMAGTALRGAIIRLSNPTGEAEKLMKQLGIQVKNADGSFKSLTDIVKQFEPHAKNVQLFAEVFGQRAGPGMVNIVRQGSGVLAEFTEVLRQSGGTAQHIADIQMRGLRGAFYELVAAAEALAISIGESGLGKAFETLTRSVAEALRVMNQWVGAAQPLHSQGLQTLTTSLGDLNEQLARVDEQIARHESRPASGLREFFSGFGSTGAINDLKKQRQAIVEQIQPLEEYVRLQRQLQQTALNAKGRFNTAIVPADEESFLPSFGGFDETASKRKAAISQLQALESEYLRSTQQNRRLIEVEYERELDRFNELLKQKLISQEEYEDARFHLTALTAERLQELENESLRLFQDIGQTISSSLEGAFRSFIEEGKLDFNELTRSILADIATISLRMHVLQPLFGGGAGGGQGAFANALSGLFMHGGGIVGSSGSRRSVPAAAFLGAPRLHNGGSFLRSDERPAILQTGERVLSRGQSQGEGGVVVQIVNNTGADIKQERGRTSDGRELRRFIVQEMNQTITRGQVDGSMRTRFGNQPVGTRR